ncbi:ankyrin repeat and fibronectin type-III domain-containing protein 1 isoform X2 [Denticeps clupeoides]|nr:ankyrin repeat and fibronectin type-III domain-containing protein 1-like isoform X2 [Denticeps clupeoides]
MSLTVRDTPKRRKSLGPVCPKRIDRNLSVKLRGRDSPEDEEENATAMGKPTTLWEAVESEDVLAVQSLLFRDRGCGGGESEKLTAKEWEMKRERGVNCVSEEGLVPLDVAVHTHNSTLFQVLVKAGGRHNPQLCQPSDWALKLDALVTLAGQRVAERRAALLRRARAGLQADADCQQQLHHWSLRQKLYCRMRDRFQHTVPPGPPSHANLMVMSATSLLVTIREPACVATGLVIRYKVEWSNSDAFLTLSGTGYIDDTRNPVYSITGLNTGELYYVKVSAYNVKGWGPPQTSIPACAAPSSWLECNGVRIRRSSLEDEVRKLLEQIREPHYRGFCTEAPKQISPSKRVSVSRSLKQLFQSPNTFVRHLQRGVYMLAVFYTKDKVLVTADDQFPLVEIQCCSTSIMQDFIWLAKLSYAWDQVPCLQQALRSSLSSSSSLLQNRHSVLRAVAQLQAALRTQDIGQVYFEPIKDRQGNMLIMTLKECLPPAYSSDHILHWVPLSHMEKNPSQTALLPEPTALDIVTGHLKEKMSYHRHSGQQAHPGLHVGILKLSSSVEQLTVLVPQRLPNLLYHARVRTNPHVSRDEWLWLQTQGSRSVLGDERKSESSSLMMFVQALRSAITVLLTRLNIPLYRAYQYRVYTQELLQFGEKLSLLLLLPPTKEFTVSYGFMESTQDPGLNIPLTVFELVHFGAYAHDFLGKYCQAWVRLELDAYLSQQALREALDSKEIAVARERLSHVTELSQSLDLVWREVRWIMDVMQCIRSKQGTGTVPLGLVLGGQPPPASVALEEQEHRRDVTTLMPRHLRTQKTLSEYFSHTDSDPLVRYGAAESTRLALAEKLEQHHAGDGCANDSLHFSVNKEVQQMSCLQQSDSFAPFSLLKEDEKHDPVAWMIERFDKFELQSKSFLGLSPVDLRLESDCCFESALEYGNHEKYPHSQHWLHPKGGSGVSEELLSFSGTSTSPAWAGPHESAAAANKSKVQSLPVRCLVEWVTSSKE